MNDELILLDQDASVLAKKGLRLKIKYAEETRQYFIKFKKIDLDRDDTPPVIDFYYAMSPTKKSHALTNKPSPVRLPDDLKNAIAILQNKNSGLTEIFAAENNTLRIQKIIEYCQKFNEEKDIAAARLEMSHLLPHSIPADIHELMSRLCLQYGSCHERSRSFMVLASYFDIPVRVNINDSHEYVEYFDGNEWTLCNNLGGSFSIEQTFDPWNNPLSLEEVHLSDEKNVPNDEFHSKFNPDERVLDEASGFNDWYQNLLSLPGYPPLLQFKNDQQALDFHSCVMHSSNNVLGENYFYIQSPDDFERLLRPIQVSSNECHPIEGPLLKLLNSQTPGTLLINWSNFNEKEIATYKSILEKKEPTLQRYVIPPNIKKINISLPHTKACSSFRSRTQKVAWPKQLDVHPVLSINSVSHPVDDAIDLYESKNWESILIGRQKITAKGFVYEPGILLDALSEGKNVIDLTGVPTDPALTLFFERLKREKKFYANGEWKIIPENFTIHFSKTPFVDATPLPAFDHAIHLDAPVFYVNKQNYDALFERFTLRQDKKAEQHAGLLEEMPDNAILVLTDALSPGEMRRLRKEINPHIQLKIMPHLIGEKSAPLSIHSASRVILTSDVDAAERQLQEKATVSIPISHTTQFSDLFENASLLRTEEKTGIALHFDHYYFELYDRLKKGETVILKGDISTELYHQLETLFATPSYLMINGKAESIPGKFILMTPFKKDFPNLFDSSSQRVTHELVWERDIPSYLMSEMSIDLAKAKELSTRIQAFYEGAKKISHNGKTTPPELLITEDIVLEIARAMLRHPEKNPVKRTVLQNYTEDKKSYAELNALAKTHLYTKKPKVKSNEPLEKKQERLIREILENSPFVELRGTPGTGKTHFIEHILPEKDSFWGEKDIIKWLESGTSDGEKYLLLDEANMKEPGYWDFLRGLKTGTIHYKGKFYSNLNPAIHKVIFTGNPESYPKRHYHSFLQEVPKVYFKSHTDDYLFKRIILPEHNRCQLDDALKIEIGRLIIAVFKETKERLPFESLSIRDIKAVLDHFSYPDFPSSHEAIARAHLACQQTFAGLFKTRVSRKTYFTFLEKTFHGQSAPFNNYSHDLDPTYYLPASQQLLWHSVNQCVERGGLVSEGARRGVLVEGPSGVGKSELMLQAVTNQGFVHHNQYDKNDPQAKIYFHLSMGTENVSEELLKAWKLSKTHPVVLILDELNLLKQKDEALLTTILEGRSPEKEKSKKEKPKEEKSAEKKHKKNKCNLVVLASQNSQLEAGRPPLSHALLNRFDRFYEEPLTRRDLLDICCQSGKFSDDINDPRAGRYVDRFLKQSKLHPDTINTRTFFDDLDKLPEINSQGQHQHRLHKPAKKEATQTTTHTIPKSGFRT